MSFGEAEAYLDGLGIDAMKSLKPSLDRIEALCEALNHPERAVPAVHITGTNGKTTAARMITSLLAATGLSVGTYTSPHLESVTERIALSGETLSEEVFGEVFENVLPYVQLVESRLGEKLSYFELLTGMFFFWAAEQPVDAIVVEVGMGGEWDATNVVDGVISVITNVGLDHTGFLGTEKETIAQEKAGIIKPDGALVTAERVPALRNLFQEIAESRRSEVALIDKHFAVDDNRVAFGGRYLTLTSSAGTYEELFLPLHGSHQGLNAAVALEAVTRFLPAQRLEQAVVAEGFGNVKAPGRLEALRMRGETAPPVVLDVAHNPDGVSAMISSLVEAFAFKKVRFVVGIARDKDFEGMLAEIGRVPASIVVTEPKQVRAVPAAELKEVALELGLPCEVIEDVPRAVDTAIAQAEPIELVCVTGSHYVVGEARAHLLRS